MFLRECDVKLISGIITNKRSCKNEQSWRAKLRSVMQSACDDRESYIIQRRSSAFSACLFDEMIRARVIKKHAPDTTALTPSAVCKLLSAFGAEHQATLVSEAVDKLVKTGTLQTDAKCVSSVDMSSRKRRRKQPEIKHLKDDPPRRIKRTRLVATTSEFETVTARCLRSTTVSDRQVAKSDFRLKAMSKEQWRVLANSPWALS